jgi:Uma2 family endonuclease
MNMLLSPPIRIRTVADLVQHLGDIPLERIRMKPIPGTATEADVLAAERKDRRLCELVDGTLVDKAMGFFEARLAVVIAAILDDFAFTHGLGAAFGPDAMLRLMPGQVRIPDVSYFGMARFPDGQIPRDPIAAIVPDLAIEVLSKSNTKKEMQRKRREYFKAGAQQVWLVDGKRRQIRVYTSPGRSRLYKNSDTLTGGKVLPGFTLALKALFDRAELRR